MAPPNAESTPHGDGPTPPAMSGSAARPAGGADAMGTERFRDLSQLLDRSHLYSQFLCEQMQECITTPSSRRRDSKDGVQPSGESDEGDDDSERLADEELSRPASAAEVQELVPLLQHSQSLGLKQFQLVGVRWMIALWQNGLNGILADQMGLGKTVQTIAFLGHLVSKGVTGPFLIVAPLSTLRNWVDEFAKWTPSINAVLYHGSKEERTELRKKHLVGNQWNPNVMVTSYEIVMNDQKKNTRVFKAVEWKYIVVDEGHRLKNSSCQLIKALRLVPSANKLLLTGTPLQNNLAELWSLLNFLLPDIFTSLQKFEQWFDFSALDEEAGDADRRKFLEEEQHNQVVTKLHSILRPFLLRRIKSEVEQGLPPKREFILFASLTPTQRDLYQKILEKSLYETEDGRKVKMSELRNTLMQLRKTCNHPDLILSESDENAHYPPLSTMLKQGGKLQLLDRLVSLLLQVPARTNKRQKRVKADEGHKILIFSQMTRVLDFLEYFFEEKGISFVRLDGATAQEDREAAIKEFNSNQSVKVFLLTTRAGGLGLNLTAADTVIIYDSDWNPHSDLQAIDRAHRIGQKRSVHVYRLITFNSVEERVYTRAQSRMVLEKLVITKGNFVGHDKASPKSAEKGLDQSDLLKMLVCDKEEFSNSDLKYQTISDNDLEVIESREDEMLRQIPMHGPGYRRETTEDSQPLLSSIQ